MKQNPRILVVEDEVHLAEGLLFNLQAEGYEVELAHDGETALGRLLPGLVLEPGDQEVERPAPGKRSPELEVKDAIELADVVEAGRERGSAFDAILLDVMLPGRSGFEVVSALRSEHSYIPVLMLTARSRPEDVLHGLEAGADDYLAKPFDLSILLARLRVLLRRMHWQKSGAGPAPEQEAGEAEAPATYSFDGRTIDFSLLELRAKGVITRLTLMEADFLKYLSENPFRIISRKELLEQVWRVHEDTDTRAIDNFVVRLRRYLEDEPANPTYLKTVRGIGYRFLPSGE
jgi:DNA-binding response OmpR family regulator